MRFKMIGLLLPILLIFLWFLATIESNTYLEPSPEVVFTAAISVFSGGEIILDSFSTLLRLFFGFVIGASLAVFMGLIIARISLVEDFSATTINFMRFIPPLALVPLTILLLGIGEFSKVFIIAWTVFFPVYINTFSGVKNLNRKLFWVASTFGATEWQILSKVILPAAIPYIITGARIGVGFAFSVVIAAELIGAFSGLGFRMWLLESVFRVDKMLVYILLLGVYGLIADNIFVYLKNKYFFWSEQYAHLS
ncbi:MAG: ABC transporter permease [Candidatus Diapherotrites archaeon]